MAEYRGVKGESNARFYLSKFEYARTDLSQKCEKSWGDITQELLGELWIAREKLSKHGGDRRSKKYKKIKDL